MTKIAFVHHGKTSLTHAIISTMKRKNEMSDFVFGPLQTKLLNELESGKHKQGKGFMRKGDSFCCLGVCAEFVLGIDSKISPEDNDYSDEKNYIYMYDGNIGVLEQAEKLGFVNKCASLKKYVKINDKVYCTLAEMNDNGFTFKEIAKFIRDNPRNVFTGSY